MLPISPGAFCMCASAASGRPRPRPAVLCGPVPSRRGGGRGSPEGAVRYHWHVFQPALPARGATAFAKAAGMCLIFQPALPAKGATSSWLLRDCGGQISIHVPREGSDTPESMLEGKLEYISTHAPYEGSDVIGFKGCRVLGQFQPTLPVRRATPTTLSGVPVKSSFQSTLPVRGATFLARHTTAFWPVISIHAPREGSDCKPAQNKRRNFGRMSYYTEKNRKKRPKSLHWLDNKSKKAAKGKKTRCEGYAKSMTACGPHSAFIPSKAPRRRSRAVRRHVQFGCGSGRPGYKTAGCLPVCR